MVHVDRILGFIILTLLNGRDVSALGDNSEKLQSYNIDESAISLSGLSSGGFMAAQLHVIESETFMGVGVIAGGPYNCANGQLSTALTACMSSPYLMNVNGLENNARDQSSAGTIDPIEGIKNAKVYLYSGKDDTTVDPGVMAKTQTFYEDLGTSNVVFKNDIDGVHGFPTMDYGTACDRTNKQEYINDCDYDSAYHLLNHIYDNQIEEPNYSLTAPSPAGSLITFDQTEFISGTPSAISMDDIGYVFVPDSCTGGSTACRLHVAFHGCLQGASYLKTSYAENTGYNRVAALNNIIVLYPQVTSKAIDNPNGCWDFWGYSDNDYAYHDGKQTQAVMNMVKRVTSGSTGGTSPPNVVTTQETTTEKSESTSKITTAPNSNNGGDNDGKLGSYQADSNAVSVSGLGSGGFMAIQTHVAECDRIMGAGAIEGGPYYCAKDNVYTATTSCMTTPSTITMNSLYDQAESYAGSGKIASLSNLKNQNVFLYSGSNDLTVATGVVQKASEFYNTYAAAVEEEYSIPSRDGFPTVNEGGTCTRSSSNNLNNCDYPGAFNILNHIYGGSLTYPDYTGNTAPQGELYEFDQEEVVSANAASEAMLSDKGMVFVPTTCSGGVACRVHVAFHGCKSGNDKIAEDFATYAGYNEVAALNNIIVVYPRTKINLLTNPQDCWDWWGYTDKNYATSNGLQIQAVMAMIDRVTS